jgi:hypothetical protein
MMTDGLMMVVLGDPVDVVVTEEIEGHFTTKV